MGFQISWVGVKGPNKESVLQALNLEDTGTPDPENEEVFSVATLPTGWTIVFANDTGFATKEVLKQLSKDGEAVGCALSETVMCSSAWGYARGAYLWEVEHEPGRNRGMDETKVLGALPDGAAAIIARLEAKQRAEDKGDALCDHMFDAPIEICAALTGYRHDETEFEWGEPEFTALQRATPPARRAREDGDKPKGFFARLFGG